MSMPVTYSCLGREDVAAQSTGALYCAKRASRVESDARSEAGVSSSQGPGSSSRWGWRPLVGKGRGYWARVIGLIVAGAILERGLEATHVWKEARFTVYGAIHKLTPRTRIPLYTKLVLIGDDEYFGPLGRRVPIRRDYLARVIEKLYAADAAVVAVDFDLRSPAAADAATEHSDYAAETAELVRVVGQVPERTVVVLPKTTRRLSGGLFEAEAAAYDAPEGAGSGPPPLTRIRYGYIEAPDDIRQVPRSEEHTSELQSQR